MRKYHQVGGIISAPDQRILLMSLSTGQNQLSLPKFRLPVGMDMVGEFKREIAESFGLQLTFKRLLPDTWARLTFLDGGDSDFSLFHIYELATLDLPRRTDTGLALRELSELLRVAKGKTQQLSGADLAALEVFAQLG